MFIESRSVRGLVTLLSPWVTSPQCLDSKGSPVPRETAFPAALSSPSLLSAARGTLPHGPWAFSSLGATPPGPRHASFPPHGHVRW